MLNTLAELNTLAYLCDMKLIADSGSTKITWILTGADGETHIAESPGMNPALLTREEIIGTLSALVPEQWRTVPVEEAWIYAAGCRSPRESEALTSALSVHYPRARVNAASDMLGAARALCGNSAGVACILGTGSNAALYSPAEGITHSTPPLGYVLGDEGSGADIGKAIVNTVLKRVWPPQLCDRFLTDTGLAADTIIKAVYRTSEPNRFLASLTRWAATNIGLPEVGQLITGRFAEFLRRNVLTLPGADSLPVSFAGSVAHVFSEQLRAACGICGVTPGKIEKSPAKGLIEYHSQI